MRGRNDKKNTFAHTNSLLITEQPLQWWIRSRNVYM